MLLYDFSCQLFVEQRGVHGEQLFVAAVFDGAFAASVDDDGALFCLFVGVAADVDKGFDDIIESVHVVVVEHQLATAIFQHGGFVFSLWTYVWFVLFQFN